MKANPNREETKNEKNTPPFRVLSIHKRGTRPTHARYPASYLGRESTRRPEDRRASTAGITIKGFGLR
jgi:hypothetical protein